MPRRPSEERDPELTLEVADGTRQRRLRHVQTLCGAAECSSSATATKYRSSRNSLRILTPLRREYQSYVQTDLLQVERAVGVGSRAFA
jgi:hypothetical protein